MNFFKWLNERVARINPNNTARVTPDPGDSSNVETSSTFDKASRWIEQKEGQIANMGSVGNLLARTGLPTLSAAGRVATGAASKFEPVQAGLWALDATRALTDQKYREAHLDSIGKLEKKENGILGGRIDGEFFNTTAALQTFEHPIATGGALMRYSGGTQKQKKQQKNLEEDLKYALKLLQLKRKRSNAYRDVPQVTPETIKFILDQQAATKQFR